MNFQHPESLLQHPLAAAAYYNAAGAELLSTGKDDVKALQCFQTGLQYMSLVNTNFASSPLQHKKCSISISQSPRQNNNAFDNLEEKQAVTIFNRAMIFQCDQISATTTNKEDTTLCWSILEFNLALVWHRLVLSRNPVISKVGGERRALAMTLELYDACLAHASSSCCTPTDSPDELRNGSSAVTMNLILVALNNKALIYLEAYDLSMASQVADAVLSLLDATSNNSDDGCQLSLLLSPTENSWLQLNASIMKSLTLAAAA